MKRIIAGWLVILMVMGGMTGIANADSDVYTIQVDDITENNKDTSNIDIPMVSSQYKSYTSHNTIHNIDGIPHSTASKGDPGEGWIGDIQVSGGTNHQVWPSMATNNNGDIYIAFSSYDSSYGVYRIYLYKNSTDRGLSWEYINSFGNSFHDNLYPSVAIDQGTNHIYVVYETALSDSDHDIYCALYTGSTWHYYIVRADGNDDRHPSITVISGALSNNGVYIAFENDRGGADGADLILYKFTGSGFSFVKNFVGGGFGDDSWNDWPSLVGTIHQEAFYGILLCAYCKAGMGGAQRDIKCIGSGDGGDTWTSEFSIASESYDEYAPSLAVTKYYGTGIVAYTLQQSSTSYKVNYVTFDYFSISSPQTLAYPSTQTWPIIIADDYHFYMAYTVSNLIIYRTAYASTTPSWTTGSVASDTSAYADSGYRPTISLYTHTGTTYPAIAWGDYRNGEGYSNCDIYYTTPGDVPSAPTGLTATPGDAQVSLTWNVPSSDGGFEISYYKIYRGTYSGGETLLELEWNTYYTDTTVTNGVTYYYKVSAVNGVGEGALSSEVSATPQSTTGTLEGHVYDADTSALIVGAEIDIWTYSTYTDSSGYYEVDVPEGTYSSVSASKTGYETAYATVTIYNGETTVQDFYLTPSNNPPTADFTYTPTSPTTADTISFTDSSTDYDGTIVSWSWDFGDDSTSVLQNPTHQYLYGGTYYVNLEVTDNGGASDTCQKSIFVQQAELTPHDPIYISGASDFTEANGVAGGSGTESDPYIIEGWYINASAAIGIYIRNAYVYFIIRNCYIHDGKTNYNAGIYLYYVGCGTIDHVYSYNNSEGIILEEASNNNIVNCLCYNNLYYGIHLDSYSSGNRIANCTVYENSIYGIYLYLSSINNITNCAVYNNSGGIRLITSINNILTNCRCYNNSAEGIFLEYSSNNNQITNTECYSNSWHGIRLSMSSNNNVITYCNITDNMIWGVQIIYSSSYPSNYNVFHHNNFINNIDSNAIDPHTNYWDDDIGEGNYWDDYTGIDADSDGIGDTPYDIPLGSNQDHYPLMTPVGGVSEEEYFLEWNKTWGGPGSEWSSDVAFYNDEVYVVGSTDYGIGYVDVVLLKYDYSGSLIWSETWGGGNWDEAYSVEVYNGEIYVAGMTRSYGAGEADAFLLKYDLSGNLMWNKTWGGSNGEVAYSVTVYDNYIYVAGSTNSYGAGNEDVFLLKYDSSGSLLWYKIWGGSDEEEAYGVAVYNNEIYVTGHTWSYGADYCDVFLLKYDSSGSQLWNQIWSGYSYDWANDIAVYNNEVFVAGETYSYSAGALDALLLKYDTNGNLLWNTMWGGSGPDAARGIAVDNNRIYVTGYTHSCGAGYSDILLLKYDTNGNLLWNTTWGGSDYDYAEDVAVYNTEIYVTGGTFSYGVGNSDIFLLKYSKGVSIRPPLSVSVTPSSDSVTSGGNVTVTVYVTNASSGLGVENAYVEMSSNSSGSFSPINGYTDGNGYFTSTFTTPTVSVNTTIRITASARKTWHNSSSGYVDITVILPQISIEEALDTTLTGWTTGGNASWYPTTDVYYYDGDAMCSGDIDDDEVSWLQVTVTGPGNLSFYWRVFSENNWDYLKFYIDDMERDKISGHIIDWQEKAYNIIPGNHVLTWKYTKDGSISAQGDCGWLDKVDFVPGEVGFTTHDPIYINGNSDFTYENGVVSGSGTEGDPYIIEWWDINASSANGIKIKNTDVYFIIRNCVVCDGKSNNHEGIYFDNVINGKIDNIASYNNYKGIYLDESSNNTITNCTVYDSYLWGIDIHYYSDYNQIINCTAYNNSDGIFIFGYSNNNEIIGCSAYSNNGHGIYLYCGSSNNNITTCTVYDNIEDGINVDLYSTNNNIVNCIIYNDSDGIELHDFSNNTTITNCTILNNLRYGINLDESSNTIISKSNIHNNNWGGIYFHYSSNNVLDNSSIHSHSDDGIVFWYSSNNNTISNCSITNNYFGIYLMSSSSNKIHYNNIYSNTKGVYNYNSESQYIANATYNWWGSADGPSGVGSGSGDNVSSNVIYEPWLARGLYTWHWPIYINGKGNFTYANGVSSGSGTESDPYIIEDWEIDAGIANGIKIENTDAHFIIRNCIIHDDKTNYNAGIFFECVEHGIIDNIISCNNSFGILLWSSSNNSITNCAVYDNPWYGIVLGSSSNNTITKCVIYNTADYYGIDLFSSKNNQITKCTIYNNTFGICLDCSPNNMIAGNTFINDGVVIYGSNLEDYIQNIDTTNLVNGKILHYFLNQNNLEIDNWEAGQLILVNCTNFAIRNTVVSYTDVGIELAFSTDMEITNCTIYNSSYGILFSFSSNNTITNSAIYNNNPLGGVTFSSSSDNTLTNCAVHNNSWYGISASSNSLNNKVHYCDIYNNKEGIYPYTTIDARYCWWGSADGPGDTVSSYVIYQPWFVSPEKVQLYYTPISYIYIDGNPNFPSAGGVILGSGTEADPYIIDGWNITSYTAFGIAIEIRNTDAYFIIKNCIVHGVVHGGAYGGIIFYNVTHGVVNNVAVYNNSFGTWECYGIYLNSSSNNTIMNCAVYNNPYGIRLDYSSYNTIANCTVYNSSIEYVSGAYGICLSYSSNNKITNCAIYNNPDYSLRLWYSSNNTIRDCQIYDNGNGIELLYFCSNNTISDCQIYNNGNGIFVNGYLGACEYNQITNCNIYNNSAWGGGILLSYSSNSTISNCDVYNNYDGIMLYGSSNNNITNCDIYNNEYGLPVYSSSNSITNCNVYNNSGGIDLSGSSNNVSNCIVYNNPGSGISVGGASNNITNCTVYKNSNGVYLYSSANTNQLLNCVVYNNYNYGIKTEGSTNNNIINCTVYNNSYGIYLYYSSNNKFRDVVLENNTYNFGVYSIYTSDYYQDIDTSNTINGKPIYYIIEKSNLVFDDTMSIGYLGLVSCSGIKIENLTFANNIQGLLLENTSYSTISNCTVYNNFYGIYLYCHPLDNEIHYCNIYNNTNYGIYNEWYYQINATYNWWGSLEGPSGVGVGSGDNVSSYVLYDPWLTAIWEGVNQPPIAFIASIEPNPANMGETVTFTGYGEDIDGYIIAYSWYSSIDGFLSNDASFDNSSLSVGTHTIYLKVQDNKETWSLEINTTLVINAPNQLPTAHIDSITPNPATQGEIVSFSGYGADTDGTIIAYNWRSSIDGQLSTSGSFSTSSLSVGTHTIYFKVQDNNESWSTEVSESLIISPVGANMPPNAVTVYTPTSITKSSMVLTWSQNPDADFANYTIYQSTTSGVLGNAIKVITTNTTTSWTVTGLSPGTTYYFTVRVYDASGLHNDSIQVSATTLSAQVVETIGQSGGNVTLEKLTVIIPENAVSKNISFNVSTVSVEAPEGYGILSSVYNIETEVTTFDKPITITLSYEDITLPKNVSEDDLAIYKYADNTWTKLDSTVDKTNKTVSVKITTLSGFAILYKTPIEEEEEEAKPPAKPPEIPWLYIIIPVIIVVVLAAVGIGIKRRKRKVSPPPSQ